MNKESMPGALGSNDQLGVIAARVRARIVTYPTTQIVTGHTSVDQHVERSAALLYDEWVCDRRWLAIDVVRMLFIECARRGHPLILADHDLLPAPNVERSGSSA